MSTLPPAPSAAGPPPWPQVAPPRPLRWPTFVSLLIALVAIGLAIGCWVRPLPSNKASSTPPAPSYTDQQTADAKARVCTAFGKVDRAVGVLNALPQGSDGVVAAINTRQVFDVGSRYLYATLAEEPATPSDLATAVHKEASTLEEAVIDYQDGLSNSDPEMRPLVNANTAASETIRRLCK
jgi:hypothetical protein